MVVHRIRLASGLLLLTVVAVAACGGKSGNADSGMTGDLGGSSGGGSSGAAGAGGRGAGGSGTAGAGTAGTTGAGGAGTAGMTGGGGQSGAWACGEMRGIECFCIIGGSDPLPRCSDGWGCCIASVTATQGTCDCLNTTAAMCAQIAAMAPGTQVVASCPP